MNPLPGSPASWPNAAALLFVASPEGRCSTFVHTAVVNERGVRVTGAGSPIGPGGEPSPERDRRALQSPRMDALVAGPRGASPSPSAAMRVVNRAAPGA